MQDLITAESRLSPAPPDAIKLALADLHVVGLKFPPGDWKLALPLYVEALSDLPLDLLRDAIRLWIRGNPNFPRPSELRAMVRDEFDRRRARERIEMTGLQEIPVIERQSCTPEQAQAILRKYDIILPDIMQTRRVKPHYVDDCVPE